MNARVCLCMCTRPHSVALVYVFVCACVCWVNIDDCESPLPVVCGVYLCECRTFRWKNGCRPLFNVLFFWLRRRSMLHVHISQFTATFRNNDDECSDECTTVCTLSDAFNANHRNEMLLLFTSTGIFGADAVAELLLEIWNEFSLLVVVVLLLLATNVIFLENLNKKVQQLLVITAKIVNYPLKRRKSFV